MTFTQLRSKQGRDLTSSERAEIEREYSERFAPFATSFDPNCPNRYNDAIILILNDMKTKDTGGYRLKVGIAFKWRNRMYTHKNLTTEAAKAYIAMDAKNKRNFAELPEDQE